MKPRKICPLLRTIFKIDPMFYYRLLFDSSIGLYITLKKNKGGTMGDLLRLEIQRIKDELPKLQGLSDE